MSRKMIAAGAVLAALGACAPTSNSSLATADFPPIGLSGQAAYLSARTSGPVPQARISASEQERLRVERLQRPQATPAAAPARPVPVAAGATASGLAGQAQQIMAELCLPRLNDLRNLRGATQQLNQRLFGEAPPINTADYTLGGVRLGRIGPLRFTPEVDRVNSEFGCGIAVRGEDPNAIAQPIFAQMRAAGLTLGAGRDSIPGQRIYPVRGAGRSDLSLRVTTVRRLGRPIINMVFTHR